MGRSKGYMQTSADDQEFWHDNAQHSGGAPAASSGALSGGLAQLLSSVVPAQGHLQASPPQTLSPQA